MLENTNDLWIESEEIEVENFTDFDLNKYDQEPTPEEIEYVEDQKYMCPSTDYFMEHEAEWEEIDNLVLEYQKSFQNPDDPVQRVKSDRAATQLLDRFYPFIKKYLNLIKTGQINFNNTEQKTFVVLFIEDKNLKYALRSGKPIDKNLKAQIFQRFNFVKETYGNEDEEVILTDLHALFFILAKRYKKIERSFCCYLYYVYKFEVARWIQRFIANPANIHYKNYSYEELNSMGSRELANNTIDLDIEDKICTDKSGVPDISWIQGFNCSEGFQNMTPLERKILIKYYLEKKNDRQIAREYGIHINTCNTKRHQALEKLAKALGVSKNDILRTRNSGITRA